MKRLLIAGALLSALACGGVADAATPPRSELKHFSCREAQNPRHRELSITAVMRPVSGTQHMAIKFTLLRETAGARSFKPVKAGDLGHWLSPSDSTLGQRPADVWTVTKPIHDLAGPAVYRVRVEFRWTGSHNRVLSHALHNTPVCRAD